MRICRGRGVCGGVYGGENNRLGRGGVTSPPVWRARGAMRARSPSFHFRKHNTTTNTL
jgi:hypothetical protein